MESNNNTIFLLTDVENSPLLFRREYPDWWFYYIKVLGSNNTIQAIEASSGTLSANDLGQIESCCLVNTEQKGRDIKIGTSICCRFFAFPFSQNGKLGIQEHQYSVRLTPFGSTTKNVIFSSIFVIVPEWTGGHNLEGSAAVHDWFLRPEKCKNLLPSLVLLWCNCSCSSNKSDLPETN